MNYIMQEAVLPSQVITGEMIIPDTGELLTGVAETAIEEIYGKKYLKVTSPEQDGAINIIGLSEEEVPFDGLSEAIQHSTTHLSMSSQQIRERMQAYSYSGTEDMSDMLSIGEEQNLEFSFYDIYRGNTAYYYVVYRLRQNFTVLVGRQSLPEPILIKTTIDPDGTLPRTPQYGQHGDEDFEYDPETIIFYNNPENQ